MIDLSPLEKAKSKDKEKVILNVRNGFVGNEFMQFVCLCVFSHVSGGNGWDVFMV